MKKIMPLLMAFGLLAACGKTSADDSSELFISAASSLKDVMDAAEKEFEETHPEVDIAFNFGSSGNLRNQIQQGAPVDLFLSASAKDMEILQEEELVYKEDIRDFAENRLVLASAGELSEQDPIETLAGSSGVIAVGEPESVPVGSYTKEALEELGLWDNLEGRLIFAKDARQVVSYVESGNAEMGIVYSSDAQRSSGIKTTVDLPQDGVDIVYPAGIMQGAKNKEAAELFLDYLTGSKGQKLLEDYGFFVGKGELD
ncbi:molybdate ABC transporter substrate-binding protein [Planococcus sp. FY231025]|uniref:molybdate ABC transporter substrate-binding protein n=1 Tax=Planococcus sp. FY231025 TaxID=3455699 RepID=UPI003F8F02BA